MTRLTDPVNHFTTGGENFTYGRGPGATSAADTAVLQNAQRTTMTWETVKRARDAADASVMVNMASAGYKPYQNPLHYGLSTGLWGFRVVVAASTLPRRRTWAQRLLTLPWRPLKTHELVPNPYLPEPRYYWRYGDTLYCREEDYRTLKEAARRAP